MQRVSILNPDLTLTMSQRPVPEPGPGEVLVRVKSVGVCGSDIHYFEHGRIADFVVEGPLVLGHEASGVVEGLGDGVQILLKARRSQWNRVCHVARAMSADRVVTTFARMLSSSRRHRSTALFASTWFCHDLSCIRCLRTCPSMQLALVEPLSVGVWACQKANVSLGTRVVITGCGPIEAICALVARARGADVVAVTDINAQRRQKVEDLGFTTCDPATAAMPEADVLLECSGSATAIDQGIRCLAPAGVAVLIGMTPSDTVPLPVGALQGKEVWLTGTFRYANTYPTAVELLSSGFVDLDSIVSASYPLEEVENALTHGKSHPADMKVMVHP